MEMQRRKTMVAWLSVISNASLVSMKLVVGILIGSVSVISEAIHSGVDLLASFIALFAVKTSVKPPDERHPYGHGKVENISGTLEALLIFFAAGWIIAEAIHKLRENDKLEPLDWGIVVMFISAAANYFISRLLFKVGKESHSVALEADAWHLRTDVYTSAGVMLGLLLIWLGKIFYPAVNLDWLDPVFAIGVALLIIHAAYNLTVTSAKDLLDVNLPAEEEDWIKNLIVQHREVINGFHCLKTRKAGPYRFVEFHLLVDRNMTVEESHDITEKLSSAIEEHFPNTNTTIHIEPCDNICIEDCIRGCLLNDAERTNLLAINPHKEEKKTD